MSQIKKKFIKNNAVDGAKLLLLNEQSVRALDASGNAVELMKLDASGDLRLLVLPKSDVDPTSSEHLARKGYVDAEVAGALSSANSYADAQIAATVGAAPDLLNTLQELASALGDDANFASTVASQISALDGRLDTLEGDDSVADSVEQRISERLNPSDSRRMLYVDLTAPGGWHKPTESLSYTPDGTVFKPFNDIQAAINHGYTQLDDMTYGQPDANHDFCVVVRALASGDATGSDVSMQTGNNARPLSIVIDPSAIRQAAGLNALSSVGGGKMTLMFEDGNFGAIIPIKLVGTITISGQYTTRIKMKNVNIEAPGFTAGNPPTVLSINGTAGRHYFDNCQFNGKVSLVGSWQRWHDFYNCATYGYALTGASTGSVYSYNTIVDGLTTVSTGVMAFSTSDRIHSISHTAGTLAMTRCALSNSAGLVSSAAAPGVLFLRDVSFHNGAAYCALTKTGSAPYMFNNVMRSDAADEAMVGTRLVLGASSADLKFVSQDASKWNAGASPISVRSALDEVAGKISNLSQTVSNLAVVTGGGALSAQDIANGYIDLGADISSIMSSSVQAWVDRLAIFENYDFIIMSVGSTTHLVFEGSLLPGGDEALAEGDVIQFRYWNV